MTDEKIILGIKSLSNKQSEELCHLLARSSNNDKLSIIIGFLKGLEVSV